jgi:nuclease S1
LKKLIALLLLGTLVPSQVAAWGPKGHAIVADIATAHLTSQTRNNLKLLGEGSLASIASWGDEVRKQRDESYGWHFVDIPKDAAGFSDERDCFRPQDKHKGADTDHQNCVVDRIQMFAKVLGSENAGREERIEALKWLVHFVGDIHQPLHAVEEARGGNDIKLPAFGSEKCGDYPCNLHWVWDSILLEHAGYPEAEYVARLKKLIRQKHLEQKAGGGPVDWANESHLEARQIIERNAAAIDERYYEAYIGLVDQKLALAGLRLATLLNDTLGKVPAAKLKAELMQRK